MSEIEVPSEPQKVRRDEEQDCTCGGESSIRPKARARTSPTFIPAPSTMTAGHTIYYEV